MERNIVAAGRKINILRVWFPDNIHAEDILIEALRLRQVAHLQGDVAHSFQSGDTTHERHYITPHCKCSEVQIGHLPGIVKRTIVRL